jgi:Reverse transcriptase (RNA-dependent DNA polymerase)
MSASTKVPDLVLDHVLDNVLRLDPLSKVGLDYFGVTDMFGLLTVDPRVDLQGDYVIATPSTETSGYLHHLSAVTIRNIQSIQSWYTEQAEVDYTRVDFMALDQMTFRKFSMGLTFQRGVKIEEPEPDTPFSSSAPTPSLSLQNRELESFQRSIKRSPGDYNKFKDDSRWKQWNRHLKATANSHGLNDVLNPTFVPSTVTAVELFACQQKFMYSVFEQCMLTTKSKHIVQLHEHTWDAQKVYSGLVEVYEEDLSASLAAADLRTQITLLRLDDKWKKGIETFLQVWLSKVLELEQVEDALVSDVTKRQWLTTTLSSSTTMNSCIKQAQVTEMTMLGFGHAKEGMAWDNFFKLVMAHAKLIDHAKTTTNARLRETHSTQTTTATSSGRGGGRTTNPGRGGGRGTGAHGRGRGRGAYVERIFTTVTGHNMEMKANMKFQPEEWIKLSPAQQLKIKNLRTSATSTPPSYQAHATVTAPAPVPSVTETAGSNIRSVLSARAARSTNDDSATAQQVTVNGHTYQRITNAANVKYHVNQSSVMSHKGSLIDGGANGGMSGSDVRVIETTLSKADVTGIADHAVVDLPISTVAGLIDTSNGCIIGIFHQYAHLGTGKTIHSTNQFKAFGLQVIDTPRFLRGSQQIHHPDGYVIPLSIRNGLPYMDMCPPSDSDMESYPHVFFTSDDTWDPTFLDDEYTVEDMEITAHDLVPSYGWKELNKYGEFLQRECETHFVLAIQPYPETSIPEDFDTYVDNTIREVHLNNVHPKQHDFNRLKPNFGFVPALRIQKTIENTTQFCRLDNRLPLRKHFKTRFPAANIPRRNEIVATDTFFSDIAAHDDGILGHGGANMVQLYTGIKSLITAIFPMKTESEMPGTLLDFIRKLGAPNGLFSDNAKVQIGKTVQTILRMYAIDDLQCEPHHQHQNPAERRIQDVKKLSNQIMDRTGTPPEYWLLCLLYVIFLLNRLSTESLDWLTPFEKAFGQKPDISALLAFHWWEPVYFASHGSYPDTKERSGRMVGIAEHQGDAMTWLILDDITLQVVTRSSVRSALDPDTPNIRAEQASLASDAGEFSKPIKSVSDLMGHTNPSSLNLPKFSPEELTGLTFLREMDDGQTYRATIVQKIIDHDSQNHEKIKFLVKLGHGEFDEIIEYNELSAIVEAQHEAEMENPDVVWSFQQIKGHQGPLRKTHPEYKGSAYNVLVQWEDGSETYEPLEIIIKDDPVSVANYAAQNNLIDTPGWKRVRHLAKNQKKLDRMVNQARLAFNNGRSSAPTYSFGIKVPRNVKQALQYDEENGNTLWQDAMTLEIGNVQAYNTFKDMGKVKFIPGYKKIIVHFVFAVKHDLRHKARLVAGGHLTDPTMEGSYSSVVSLRSLRICLVAAELNSLKTMVGDISSAYLEAETKEKVCFTAGPEFGELEGHTFIIFKALYGLRTSGASWHQRFSDTLRDLGYKPCKADNDVWIKDCGSHYEYICVYVDDIMHMSKNPQELFDALKDIYNYNLAGVGEPSYHLGGNFFRDSDGTLAWGAQSYVKKMLLTYEKLFGQNPKEFSAPMEEGDHPELDLTPELDAADIKVYQSLIGALQWAVTLGRFDIFIGVATMSGFRIAPRQGHMDRLKRMYGYLKRQPDGAVRFRTGIPDHESRDTPKQYEWINSVYGPNQEELPDDMPTPKGKVMRTTCYADANLLHCLATGRSMSGIIHLLNQTPIQWFCKKQNVVETATYGSEFMVARQATEQIMDLRYTLRMLGIPIDGPAWLFGDNASVITSSTIPHSNLNKRHNALSYHRVREAISAEVMYFIHMDGKLNPSDIMTKFLGWTKFWPLIQPFLFWKGETIKGATDTTTMTEVISMIKDQSPSGLRGVTRGNSDKVNPPRDNSVKVNPSDEIPKNDSNNSGSHQATDFVMVQPDKDNPKGNPLPSLVVASTKVRFLLPVAKGPYDIGIVPPIPQVLPRAHHVQAQALPRAHHVQAPIVMTPPNVVTPPNVTQVPAFAQTTWSHAPYDQPIDDGDQPIDEGWIKVPGRKSTQKPKTSNYWTKGISSESTQKATYAIAHVEAGTSKVPSSTS